MNYKKNYDRCYYKHRHQKTIYSAEKILSLLLKCLPPVQSAIDFGCGVGTWLKVLKEKGVQEIHGMDGDWIDFDLLEIPKKNFSQVDFEKKIKLVKKYDLAISLEVAEHLPAEVAPQFIDTIVTASDFIIFSAAIPYQGGNNHINEQWQDYWVNLFDKRGFAALDLIRKQIWNDEKIHLWYRQNIIIFVNRFKLKLVNSRVNDNDVFPFSVVHPQIFIKMIEKINNEKT